MLVVRAGADRAQGGGAGPRPGSRPLSRAAVLGGGSCVQRKAEAEWVARRAVGSGWRPFPLTRPGPSAPWLKPAWSPWSLGHGNCWSSEDSHLLMKGSGRV